MFMPPEVWPVVPYNPTINYKFDLYSAGETLYWLICGQTFHEYIFDAYGNRGETVIARQLQSTSPHTYCKKSGDAQKLLQIVVDNLMIARTKASTVIQDSLFDGVETLKIITPPQNKPQQKPVIAQPVIEIEEVQEEAQRSP